MKLAKRQNLLFVGLFSIILFIFYPTLFLGTSASLVGDHLIQHYPWAWLLADSLNKCTIPFWTNAIQLGFPITAESQIGSFYLPNIFLYLLLPFKFAYAYVNLFHFFISGLGTFVYSRQLKLGVVGASIVTAIFVFGAAYGGAYYNITSLKTISWFPLLLWFLEKYLCKKKKRYLVIFSLVLGQSAMAGYLQVAAFMYIMLGVYVVLRIFFFETNELSQLASQKCFFLFWVGIAFLASILFALPQLFLTFELALRSNRVSVVEEYAYVGSMSPLAISTFFISSAQGLFKGNTIYSGIFSIYLLVGAAGSNTVRQSKVFWLWVTMIVIAFFLAIGQWSPLYIGIIKITHFYSFRTPMKFLVFICFGLAIIAGMGGDSAWRSCSLKKPDFLIKLVGRLYVVFIGLLTVSAALLFFFLTKGKNITVNAAKWLIDTYIYGKAGHPHSIAIYHQKIEEYLEKVGTLFSVSEYPRHILAYGTVFVGVVFAMWALKSKQITRRWFFCGILFLSIDLYVYSWCDIKLDFASYASVDSSTKPITELLIGDEVQELKRIYSFKHTTESRPFTPSLNLIYGVEEMGAYSPFLFKRYYDLLNQFGNIDDSNHAENPNKKFVLDRIPILSFLNISHVLSTSELNNKNLKLIIADKLNKTYIYQNLEKPALGHFISDYHIYSDWKEIRMAFLEQGFDPRKSVLLEERELVAANLDRVKTREGDSNVVLEKRLNDQEIWALDARSSGFFVVSETVYPGWRVYVNGKEERILAANGLFRCIWIPEPGKYSIMFRYSPFHSLWGKS